MPIVTCKCGCGRQWAVLTRHRNGRRHPECQKAYNRERSRAYARAKELASPSRAARVRAREAARNERAITQRHRLEAALRARVYQDAALEPDDISEDEIERRFERAKAEIRSRRGAQRAA
ncbi:MAG: hypothetical protein AB7P99_16435 [Vicinamibacterales bacterium]